jgi:hypothetical protein
MTVNLWAKPAAERGSLYQPRKRPPHGAANAAPSTSTIRLIRAPPLPTDSYVTDTASQYSYK